MRRHWGRLVLLATILGSAAPMAAQDSARDVASAFFKAVAEERWRDAAALVDLRALERHRRQQVEWMRKPAPEPTITVEELLRHDPEMPREVAEYQVKRSRKARGDFPREMLEHEYAGVTSVDTLAALSPLDAAARWLQAQDHRWMWRRAQRDAARRGCPPWPESEAPALTLQHEILGVVVSDTLAYVLHDDPVFRMKSGGIDLEGPAPSVMQLRRRAGRWEILPRPDVLRTAGSIVSFHCEPVAPTPGKPPGVG